MVGAEDPVQPQAHLFLDGRDRGQRQRGDEGADQARPRQVHAFAEHAAQHCETHAPPARREARQEGLPLFGWHGLGLAPLRQVRAQARQPVGGLLQVLEAAEEGQVVAGRLVELAADDPHQRVERARAVRVAGGQPLRHAHAQVGRRKHRRHVEPGHVLGQPQQVDGVLRGAQRSREQHRAVQRLEAWPQEARRHHVAQREGGIGAAVAGFALGLGLGLAAGPCRRFGGFGRRGARDVEHRMLGQLVGQLHEALQLEVEVQQGPHGQGLALEVRSQGRAQAQQRQHQAVGDGVERGVVLRLLLRQAVGGLQQAVEGGLQRRRGRAPRRLQLAQSPGGAEHLPRPVDEVVRLVHQQAHAPVQRLRQPPQLAARVEGVVHVAHQHVGPAHQLLPQVVGAQAVAQRHAALRGRVEPALVDGLLPRRGQAVVEAAGQGAGVAVASLVGVLARLLLRHQRQHAQRAARGALAQALQRVQRRDAAGALAGQVGQLVDALPRHRAQQREQRAHGLADAGGRLRQQAAPRDGGAVHGLGQLALAGPEIARREAQLRQPHVARAAVRGFPGGPGGELAAARLEGRLELFGTAELLQRLLGLRVDVVVNQRQRQLGHPVRAAVQRAVSLQLRPVQLAAVVGDVLDPAADGLDLFQATAARVVAVGAPPHAQGSAHAFERDLRLVVGAPARSHQLLAVEALQRGGRGREAAVQVARLGGELAQAAHRHGVRPGGRCGGLGSGGHRHSGGRRAQGARKKGREPAGAGRGR